MQAQIDKRTKPQILQALEEALGREEMLMGQIEMLQHQLGACQKPENGERIEISEEPLTATKIPFRIDYYRTTEKGPLKGIIEHLPTREKKSFKGDGREAIAGFITGILPVFAEMIPTSKANSETLASEEKAVVPPRLMERIRAAYQQELSQSSEPA